MPFRGLEPRGQEVYAMTYRNLYLRTPYQTRRATFGGIDMFNAVLTAVSDTRRHAHEHGTGVLGESKVYIEIDGKFAISMINLAHYSDEPLDEQAAWFEVAIKEDGEMLESPDGGEALFQVRYNHLKALFEAIKQSTDSITRMGLWTALYRLEEKVDFNVAKEAYKRAFRVMKKEDQAIKAETAEEMAYQTKYVFYFTRFNQTGNKADKAKADFLLDQLRLMIQQRLARQG